MLGGRDGQRCLLTRRNPKKKIDAKGCNHFGKYKRAESRFAHKITSLNSWLGLLATRFYRV